MGTARGAPGGGVVVEGAGRDGVEAGAGQAVGGDDLCLDTVYPAGWNSAPPAIDPRHVRDVIQGVLSDLDRKWRVPPVVFCAELARQVVAALAAEPSVLNALARQVALAVRGESVARRLKARGVRLRVEAGVLRAGPPEALTPGVQATIRRHKEALVASLLG